ncbi:Chaperone protein DnaJ [Candidatus Vidania fulgoroideae]|nr:Chaperone protein DnaJ [Candidatus Vidania fulgoroideae]
MDKYYKILGIEKNASPSEVKKAYRRLAMKYHPDINKEKDAEEKFKEIKEAYEKITNKGREQESYENVYEGNEEEFAFESIIGNFFKDENYEEEEFNDFVFSAVLSVEQAYRGMLYEKYISLYKLCSLCKGERNKKGTKKKICFKCKGTGTYRNFKNFFTINYPCSFCKGEGFIIKQFCSKCKGKGKIMYSEKISVNIPKGVSEGMKFKIKDKKNISSLKPIKYEDVYLEVRIKNNKEYSLDQYENLYCKREIFFLDAIIGGDFSFEIFDEKISVFVPECTEDGKIFFFKKRGFFSYRKNKKTDLYIELKTTFPKRINYTQKKGLKKVRILFEK